MNNFSRYPVVAKTPLEPVRRRLFRGGFRRQYDLPRQQPGTVLVLQVGDRFVVVSSARARYAGRRIADAVAAVVVSLNRHAVSADMDLPSPWPDMVFHVAATYNCLVTDVALLLQFGCWDVQPQLRLHLADDPLILTLIADADPSARELTRLRLQSHAVARNVISPPYVPGMTCDLIRLSVDLRAEVSPAPSGTAPMRAEPDRYPDEPAGPAPQDYYVWDG